MGSNWRHSFIKPIFIIVAFCIFSAGAICNAIGSEQDMILIPAGPFKMGSSDKDLSLIHI